MREERSNLAGAQTIDDSVDLRGSVGGDVTVIEGGKLYVRGAIYGKLTVSAGGRAHVYGHVQGDVVVAEGAKLIHSGVIGGDLVNNGGRLHVDKIAKTSGKIRTSPTGKTTFQADEDEDDGEVVRHTIPIK